MNLDDFQRIIEYHPVWVATISYAVTQMVKLARKSRLIFVNAFIIRSTSVFSGAVSGAFIFNMPLIEAFGAGLAIGCAVFIAYDIITLSIKFASENIKSRLGGKQ